MTSSDVRAAITRAAVKYGVDPRTLAAFARIESSGDPNARTGSYKGLFQLSDSEFGKYGGGNIYNADDNANAAAAKLKVETDRFRKSHGRDPSAADLYMVHQQGEGGYAKHSANPDAPAWQNMYSTAEGRQKGPEWAKQAIWGNVPNDLKAKFGSVDNLTSKQFMDLWAGKVERNGGDVGSAVATAHSTSTQPDQPAGAVKDGDMFDLMAALGGKNLMGSLGKGLGNENLVNAGDQNSIFGSLNALFGGGQGSGQQPQQGQSQNPMGDANMKLAQGAQQAAGDGEESIPTYQRKPVDLSNLMKIIQQRSQLGAAPRQPGTGMGA